MSNNKNLIFEKIVGLGSTCYTKMQINKYLNPESPIYWITKPGQSDIFDWLIIKDYNLLADAFNNDLKDIFEFDDLSIPENTAFVYNNKYHMNWKHLFDSLGDYGGEAIYDKKERLTKKLLFKFYPTLRSKIEYLRNKFLDLKNKNTIYLISTGNMDYHNTGVLFPKIEDLRKLRDSLIKMRGNNNFIILYIPMYKQYESEDNIFVYEDPLWCLDGGACKNGFDIYTKILEEFKINKY